MGQPTQDERILILQHCQRACRRACSIHENYVFLTILVGFTTTNLYFLHPNIATWKSHHIAKRQQTSLWQRSARFRSSGSCISAGPSSKLICKALKTPINRNNWSQEIAALSRDLLAGGLGDNPVKYPGDKISCDT